jgi:hypothetical protein
MTRLHAARYAFFLALLVFALCVLFFSRKEN